jgi:NADH:ubiquinone oxidoreductase subunit C
MLSSNIKILSNLIITSYLDSHNESLITVVTLHTDILKTAVFFKLSSINNYTMAVDLFAIDNIKDEFRFTIIYLIRNINQNFFLRLITKVSLFKAVLSLSSIFPAFD